MRVACIGLAVVAALGITAVIQSCSPPVAPSCCPCSGAAPTDAGIPPAGGSL
jgi:hypothetical protein